MQTFTCHKDMFHVTCICVHVAPPGGWLILFSVNFPQQVFSLILLFNCVHLFLDNNAVFFCSGTVGTSYKMLYKTMRSQYLKILATKVRISCDA